MIFYSFCALDEKLEASQIPGMNFKRFIISPSTPLDGHADWGCVHSRQTGMKFARLVSQIFNSNSRHESEMTMQAKWTKVIVILS